MRTESVFKAPEQLMRAIDEVDRLVAGGNVDLKLDFAQCTFISVDGVEWLEELLMRAPSLSANIELTNVAPSVYKVFKIARIDCIVKACGGMAPSGPVC
jgi:hypothetical protein